MFGSRSRQPAATMAVRTRLGRATGSPADKTTRYCLDAVRALPTPEGVVLQATDGKLAACILAPGELTVPVMIPAAVLPTRQLASPADITRRGDQWQSSEGRVVDAPKDDSPFPGVGDVLPQVPPRSLSVSRSKLAKSREGLPPHVVVALDLSLLNRVGDALGTGKLTLIVPVPVKPDDPTPGTSSGATSVDKPVAICPAMKGEGVRGIAVVMPLKPDHGPRHYEQVRRIVLDAERCGKPVTRRRPRAPTDQPAPPEPVAAAV
jgi:hypothetical protein